MRRRSGASSSCTIPHTARLTKSGACGGATTTTALMSSLTSGKKSFTPTRHTAGFKTLLRLYASCIYGQSS
nr:MAG TPA: hypothetical protein [Caudoviricetes sp.]